MKIRITESQYRVLSEQYTEDELKTKYVDSGLIPENQFNEIINSIKKPFYSQWLLKMVSSGFIKYEDAYKFEYYFNVFEKFKQHYPIKDLGQIKTLQDVIEFERKSKDILIKQQETEQGDISDKKNLVSQNGIQKLESVGIKYLGMVDGLQAFQVPPEVKDSKDAWNVYREILGKCSGRDKGQRISICTMAGFGNFNQVNAWRLHNTGVSGFRHYWWGNDLDYTTPMSSGTWYHAVAAYENGSRKLYLNNVQVAEDFPTGHNVPYASNLRIGVTADFVGEWFDGKIAQVVIYKRQATVGEIEALWDSGRGRFGY